jgi:hypothetical protein
MNLAQKWSPLEIQTLQELVEQGMSANQIFNTGKLPNRTYDAIRMQVQRFSFVHHKKSAVEHITEAPIVDLETFVKRYVDAFNKLCDLTDYDKADLERFRLIHTYARDYPALLAEHERLKQVEETMAEISKRLEVLETQIHSQHQ